MEETIHMFKGKNFDIKKLFLLMIPGFVFLLVLTIFISITSYQRNKAAHTSISTQVLGSEK